ncbi:MAG: ABC transporter ATP-binding protein [Coriobacteriales bacterium]|nr:ABC transporter ATP-binding protein [Coriobacteriales bacterium]
MTSLIKGTGLVKRYEGFCLDHVDLEVPSGYVVGYIGSNGSGKTTTLKGLLGLVSFDEGSVEAFDKPAGEDGLWRQNVGVVFDACQLPKEMEITDLKILGKAAYHSWDDNAYTAYLKSFGIPSDKTVETLSRGMGMKLSLAFALAHTPQLLILDEPTAGLDPIARQEVLDILRDYMTDESRGILISSHITSDLEAIADTIICLDEGKVVFNIPKDDICLKAGIARCHKDEFEAVVQNTASIQAGSTQSGLCYIRHAYSVDVLVPDRFAFTRAFPEVTVDAASIDAYMLHMLKGESL